MRIRIHFRPSLDELRDSFSSCHLAIIRQACYGLQSTMSESPAELIDRRPIATRNRKWAQATTAWLAARNVSPNAISIAACAPVSWQALLLDSPRLLIIESCSSSLRLTANMLDGMVAIASNRTSKTGELYNEIPDRISDAGVFIGAGFAWGGSVSLGYIATILAILTAYIRAALRPCWNF
jgi:hypothetical protein